jgi:hypothetical protein
MTPDLPEAGAEVLNGLRKVTRRFTAGRRRRQSDRVFRFTSLALEGQGA